MKRLSLVLVFLCFFILKPSISYSQLPQRAGWQRTLRGYMGGLDAEDFAVKLAPLQMQASYFSDADAAYRAWLFFGHQQREMMATRGLRVAGKYFTLGAIESGGQVHMRVGRGQFMDAIATAFWADWSYPGNPHHGKRAVKLRAFVAAAVDMMMQEQDFEQGHHKRSDFLGFQLIRWGYTYGVVKGVLPPEVRAAYKQGLAKMFARLEQWGPTGIHADMDMAAAVGVEYVARALGKGAWTGRAHTYIDRLLDEHFVQAGYVDHGSAYDAGYDGISLYFINWAAQLSGYRPLVAAFRKISRLKAYLTLPEPDGQRFSPFQSNPSSGHDAPHDLWRPYYRDVGAARYSDAAVYLALKGGYEGIHSMGNMRKQMKRMLGFFNSPRHRQAFTSPIRQGPPKPWKHEHWIDTNALNATACYYKRGLYGRLKALQESSSPLKRPPFARVGSFTEDFDGKYLAVKRDHYGAIVSTDRLSWWTKQGQTQSLHGFGGGNLAAFWTPKTGSVLLGGTRTDHNGGLDLSDWREWPVHALSGETARGRAFSSGLVRHPQAHYRLNGASKQVTVTGDLSGTYADPTGALAGAVPYKRVFTIEENGVQVKTSVETGAHRLEHLWEMLPVFRRNGYRQPQADPTQIAFKVDGQWQPGGPAEKNVSAIRLQRFKGTVVIDFKRPRQVRLSPREFYQDPERKYGLQARNIMIDMAARPTLNYFLRAGQSPPHKWNPKKKNSPPTVQVSLTPETPTTANKITITSKARDDDGIKELAIYWAGKKIKSCPGTRQCSATIDPVGAGAYKYYATATDTKGNSSSTDKKELTITESDRKGSDDQKENPSPNSPPAVQVSLTPETPTTANKITITSKARDDDGIKELAIYWAGKKIKSCPGTRQCSATIDPVGAGAYKYYATATDTKKANGRSKNKKIRVIAKKQNHPPITKKAILVEKGSFLEANVDHVTDTDGDNVQLIYDWRLNKQSTAMVNMPFDMNETGIDSTVKNYTNNGLDGVIHHEEGDDNWIKKGRKGGALKFDGKHEYIEVATARKMSPMHSFTVEGWIRRDDWTNDWACIISKPLSANSWKKPWVAFKLSRNGNKDNLNLQITVDKNQLVRIQSRAKIPALKWTHVAGTYNGNTLKLFINGKIDTSLVVGKKLADREGGSVLIGNSSEVGPPELFKGAMDEVKVLRRALSSAVIKRHYNTNYRGISLANTKRGQKWQVAVSATDSKVIGDILLTNTITTAQKPSVTIADSLKNDLGQNYPNPFSRSTFIPYKIKRSQKIALRLFDASGRFVRTIYSGKEKIGDGNKRVNMSGLASGIYFYQLVTEDDINTKKMTLIK